FRHTQVLTDGDRLFNAASSAACAFSFDDSNVFSLKTLETMFANGVPTDIAFPASDKKILLWYAFLQSVTPFQGGTDWQAIETWLRYGANVHVSYYGSGGMVFGFSTA